MTMTTTTEVVPYNTAPLNERYEYARQLAGAGDLIPRGLWGIPTGPDGRKLNADAVPMPSPAKILLVLETGAMLGLHPIAALQNVYIVDGKTAMSAQLMAAIVRSKGYTFTVETSGVWGPEFKAIAKLTRPGETFEYVVEWTMARAERAALLTKDNWQHYPESMAKARAISEVVREGGQDALLGIVYTPEELGAEVREDGSPVIGEDGEARTSATPIEAAPPTALPAATKRASTGTQGTRRKAPAAKVEPEAVDAEIVEDGQPELDPEPPMATYGVADENGGRVVNAANGETIPGSETPAEPEESEPDRQYRLKAERDAAEAFERDERAAQAAEQTAAAEAQAKADEQEAADAEAKARVQAKQAARAAEPEAPAGAPSKYEQITKTKLADPDDNAEVQRWYRARASAADTVEQLKFVWDQASAEKPSQMTTELRLDIAKRKGELAKPVEAEPPADSFDNV